ncbi:putative glycoside hydrolase family 15 protein, partial [Patescibacteria group bacterium]|nr:putative glycoside hydrolase family 15 protein [Patescibacteria group bacterium]
VGCCFSNSEAKDMAKFDLVILTMEAAEYNADGIKRLRELNPDITILPYVPSQGVVFSNPSNIRQQLIDEVQPDWYLRRPNGERISRYEGEYDMNITKQDVRVGITDFVDNLNTMTCKGVNCWDGVFYDVVEDNLNFLGEIDLNDDGQVDSQNYVNTQWVKAYKKMFKRTRKKLGNKKTIIINGVSNESLQANINGRMFEDFPTPWHADGNWESIVDNTKNLKKRNYNPTGIVYSAQGTQTDYKKLRYSLASGLISGTYAGYDNGIGIHNSVWIYDEYDVALGKPLGPAYNVLNNNHPKKIQKGLWRRNFENGVVILNSTKKKRKVNFKTGFEKITGTQDPDVNNGKYVGSVTVNKHDGVILLGRLSEIENAPFINGSYAKVFDAEGKKRRHSFFVYDSNHAGGSQIIKMTNKTIVAGQTDVSIYNKNGSRIAKFAPFGENYKGVVNIAIGNVGSSRKKDVSLVVGSRGSGGQVKIYDLNGNALNPGCYPYGTSFNGGVNVAVGDVMGGTKEEIIVAPRSDGGPHVKIIDKNCKLLTPGFQAYDPSSRSGVSLGVGNVTGGDREEIITGPGAGMSPHVKVFNKNGKLLTPGFFPYNKNDKSGLFITTADINEDGKDEILTNSFRIFE